MSKAGITGLISVIVVISANIFGGRISSGVVLPLLITANIISIYHFRKDIQFRDLIRIIPWALVGVIIGFIFGRRVSDNTFTTIIGLTLLFSVPILIIREWRGLESITIKNHFLVSLIGILAGFTSMVGNAAGPIMSVYLLSMNLNKNRYIVTTAWFFFIMSLMKMPIHVFFWETLDWRTLLLDLLLVPLVAVGSLIGFRIVKIIPEKPYRYFIIGVITLSSLTLVL